MPRGTRFISFDITLTPDALCAADVTILTGNRRAAVLPNPETASPSVFDSFSVTTNSIYTVDSDVNFVQLQITASGANLQAVVWGTAK